MKQRRISRFLAFVLLVAMTLSLMPATMAFAEDAVPEEEAQQGAISLVEEPETPDLTAEEGTIKAIDDPIDAEGDADQTWLKVDLADIEPTDTIAITITASDKTYVLPNAAVTSGAPVAEVVTPEDTTLTLGSAANYGWTIEPQGDGTYTITGPNGGLNLINNNKGVRINGDSASWTYDENVNRFMAADTAGNQRYLSVAVQLTPPDWRCYATNSSYSVGTTSLWKLDNGDTPVVPKVATPTASPAAGEVASGTEVTFTTATEGAAISYTTDLGGSASSETNSITATVTENVTFTVTATKDGMDPATATFTYTVPPVLGTIAEALAGAAGSKFMVKGVVTFVDGKNVYVQDETGGICLYLKTADSSIQLGDTLIGTGTKKVYYGLPELDQATVEKSEGLTLSAKETTIGALTTADVCTYVKLTDLTVTAVSGTTVSLKDAEEKTIDIYKAVLGDTTLIEGDGITFTGAVGVYNSTLQLRNTKADEITLVSPAPRLPAAPTASVPAGAVDEGTEVTFTSATEGATVLLSDDNGETWTAPNPYTVNEAVTILAKAVKDELESETVSYAYTIEPVEPVYSTIAEALAGANGTEFTVKGVVTFIDGKNVAIQDATGGINLYLTANASGITVGDTVIGTGTRATYKGLPQLSGATFEKSEGMTLTPRITTLSELKSDDLLCWYISISKLTVTAISGNNTTVQDEAGETINIFKAKADPALVVGDIINFTGILSTYDGYQLRNTLTSEITPWSDAKTGFVTDLADLTDGAMVVILNKANSIALTQIYSPNYNDGLSVTVTDGVLTGFGETEVWIVGVNDDGTYTFSTADGKKLSMDTQYSSMPLDKANDTWTVTAVPDVEGGFYIDNVGRTDTDTGAHYRMEWYASKNYWSAYYKNNDGDLFIQQFYLVDEIPTPPQPTGDDYGLTSTLATGDTVILYNAKNGVALGNTISSHKVSGVSLTPVDGVITTDKTAVAWKVTVNADGTYTFTQGDYTLGGVVSGTYNNLVVTEATYTKWTLTGPDATDFNYFMYLGDMANNFGKTYLEYYNGFTLYGSTAPDKDAFGITFYKKGADPETPAGPGETGDLVTSLSQLTDGTTVAIYSPGHHTAISSKPNGDWYLKANDAVIDANGKVTNFTSDFVWKVKVNDDGTYSFYANDDDTRSITVWPSGNYAELSLNVASYPDNTWTLTPSTKTANSFYINSPTVSTSSGQAYIEAYVRNEFEVFSGYFTKPTSSKFTESEFALQFYLIDPAEAIEAYDDGEWDGVLQKGGQYVAYNAEAESAIGLFAEANYSMRAIPTTIEEGKAAAGNGAYVFTVDTMGRYYTFEVNGKFFATNNSEELFFADPNEDGSAPENAKWFLKAKEGGYIIYNKEASYNGTPVCVEYYSSVFSGWTFSSKNDVNIYLFNFYEVVDGTEIRDGVVQVPSVIFDCEDSRYVEQDYVVSFSLDDLAESITAIAIGYTAGERTGTVTDYEVSSDGKTYSFTIPAADIDANEILESFTIQVSVTNSYEISYTGEKTVIIIDEPFFTELTPAPNSQTKEDKRPAISAKIGNAGENPTITMKVNGETVEAAMVEQTLVYTPAEDMADGRATVSVTVQRADGVTAEKTWNFTVGYSDFQLYFGQLHSHTTYSDGSGDLETALEYIASLPESSNVQFVAFTDHSNYFDATSAANPAEALNDQSLMTDASRALWNEYKNKVACFNAEHENLLAVAGFEMTWSGGPGHINTFDSDGLVSRNNSDLNNKSNDAGMKLYYQTINAGDSLSQFNHPGNTFGNFTDFSYWDETTDAHIFLVEVGNGEGQIGAGGYYPSYEQYIMALDKGWHVAPTNNQDNHKGRWGNANDARDVILTNDFSEEGIYDAIRNLRVYATEDKNLQIFYTVNDKPMGTIFSDEEAPETLNIVVTLFDQDASDGISKVELVADGGAVAYTWNNSTDLASGQLTAELSPEYSYYFVRVTQTDGDLAVTAPVWVGHAAKMGITEIKANTETVYANEETAFTTTLYNNEETAATVKSLIYTTNGDVVIGSDTNTYTIPAGGTVQASFVHTFDKAKLTTVTVTAIVELDGKEYTYTAKVELDLLDRETENTVTPIAQVRAASVENDTGYRFIIEGVVTSNASDFDKDTAFFDCVYVQDETGGICCFPVSGNYKIGDKVRIMGHTDFYQGEPELQVKTIEVIGTGSVEPTAITAAQLNDRSAEGKLVTVSGIVDSFEEANGLIQTIMVKDAEGGLARVFIDGYITTGSEVAGCVVGARISATGLASYDDTFNAPEGPFPRIRIRNRADIVCTPAQRLEDGYYLIRPDWNVEGIDAAEKFIPNSETAGEFMLRTTLTAGDQIKVVKVEGDTIVAWYPDGMGNQYTVDDAHSGQVDVFFRTEYNDAWSAFGGFFWIQSGKPVVVVGKSLTLKGKIELNFYLDIPETLFADTGAYVTINDEKLLISDAERSQVRDLSGYCFTSKVKFAQLTEDRVLRIFNGKGEPVELKDLQGSDLTETGLVYRGQDYIEYVRLNSDDAGLLAVVNALSDLGSLAQEQFQYNLEARVDVVGELSAVTADMLTDYKPTVEAETGAGVRYYGSSLLLQDVTTIRHYFKAAGGDVSGYTFTVDGVQVTPVQKGSYFYVDITGIVAKDLDRSFHVEVSGADGVLIKLDYSAMSYAYKQLNRAEEGVLTDLAKAVYLYGAAADAYFPD